MRCEDPGIGSGSEMFVDTPSEFAQQALYYITSCGRFFTEYGYEIQRENYHNHMLFYILNGRLSVTCEGRTMVAEKDEIGFINCHVPHEYHTIGNTEFLWVHLEGGNTNQFYQHILSRYGGFVFQHPCKAEFQTMLLQLLSSYQTGQLFTEAEKSQRLYTMLMRLLDGAANGNKEQSVLETAAQFMRANISKPVTLQEIAASVNMSHYHFSRLFKKAYGYSPYEYLLLARINKAKHLLKTTDLPIKTVAQQVGYLNASTFSSAFTAKVGLPPKTFRSCPL